MCDSWNVLVVSSHLENRRALVRILDALPVSVTASSALFQAQEVLARQEIHIVFSDDTLSAGTYRNLLSMRSIGKPCVVVMAHTPEAEYRYQAIAQGAFDVLQSPPSSTDVEQVLIRVVRQLHRQNEFQVQQPGSNGIEIAAPVVSIRSSKLPGIPYHIGAKS